MMMLEHVEEGLIRQKVEKDKMQCGLMLGCGTTDAIFIVRQLHQCNHSLPLADRGRVYSRYVKNVALPEPSI